MKAGISQTIVKVADRFEALSIRERIIIMITIIVLLFIAWDSTLMEPRSKKQENLIIEMQKVNKQLDTITKQMTEFSQKKSENNGPEIQKRIDDVKQLLLNVKTKQNEVTDEFVPPNQMADVLKDMLGAESGLVLKQLKSLGSSVFQKTSTMIPEVKDESGVVETPAKKAVIYKHGLQIVFEGDFFSTLKYLKALEEMPWHFYWDTVDYKVESFPKARVSIVVHTLSLEEWWIGV